MTTKTETRARKPRRYPPGDAVPRLDQQLCFALYSASGLMTQALPAAARTARPDLSAISGHAGALGAGAAHGRRARRGARARFGDVDAAAQAAGSGRPASHAGAIRPTSAGCWSSRRRRARRCASRRKDVSAGLACAIAARAERAEIPARHLDPLCREVAQRARNQSLRTAGSCLPSLTRNQFHASF